MKAIKTVWEIREYDVWGNSRDGFEVNDVMSVGEFDLAVKPTVNNVGTPNEYYSAHPTDAQIRKLFGVRCALDLDGDGWYIRVDRARDGYPIGEMVCTSHRALTWLPGEDGPEVANGAAVENRNTPKT